MKKEVKERIKSICAKLSKTPFVYVMSAVYKLVDRIEYKWFDSKWRKAGYQLPSKEEKEIFRQNVTFIFKSFERQKLAVRLIRNIQHYYPGTRIIVADDSRKPLQKYINRVSLDDHDLTVLQLPVNSGLSYGLQCALDQVSTPYVVRMDDDQLLTRRTQFGRQLQFLMEHPDVDLSGVMQFTTPLPREPEIAAQEFYHARLGYPQHRPLLPNLTRIDAEHIVVLKSSNVFLARTEKIREIGYDSHIRMIDHNDFFCRACGILISVIDTTALVHHSHNRFNRYYEKFRSDFEGDYAYIFGQLRADGRRSLK